jgi:hypothetical protein
MVSVLHLAPHPDDEAIGAPATLMGLRDAGNRVFNLVCGLGARAPDRARRRSELAAAMAHARFEYDVLDPPPAEDALVGAVEALIRRERFDLLVSPSPHDGHPRHELVGRAAGRAIATVPDAHPRWWMWGLWADLPLPTLLVPFGEDRMAEVLGVLGEYRGELARSDYRAVVTGRSRALRVQGVERVFGFGEPHAELGADPRPYAELLTEALHVDGQWRLGAPRTPAFADPLGPARPTLPIGWWIEEPSVRERAALAISEGSPDPSRAGTPRRSAAGETPRSRPPGRSG